MRFSRGHAKHTAPLATKQNPREIWCVTCNRIANDNLRSQHLFLISLYIAVVKPITSICLVLIAALSVGHAQAQKSNYVVYQIGADVTPPKPISTPLPPTPDSVNRQIKVRVSFVVAPDGSVADIRLLNRSKTDFDGYAVAAIRNWKFEPAKKDGKPVAVRLETEVRTHK